MKAASTGTDKNNQKGIAIVGMSCLLPGAPDLPTFWSNIVRGVDATREVTSKEWDLDAYYDPQSENHGMSYSKRGGFISEYSDFDPLQYGIMPSAVAGSDPDQFLTLRVAIAAMLDAGYDPANLSSDFDRDRAEIIIGCISAPGAGSMNLIHQSKTVHEIEAILRTAMPHLDDTAIGAMVETVRDNLVPCTADNIPGAMPNVLAGRIASKLGFRGRNLLIDAACASSMVAIETAVNDLLDNRCDFALAGGVHINASAVFFQMFCGLGALSRKDNIRPFDQDADGTMLGEGAGIICLKRYEDALRDGDRIYATICGVASSSDGHGGSVLAPNLEGEALAMQKAYDMAGISPSTVELLEAHGTGTPVGDVVEMQAVAKVFKSDKDAWCAVGSIKSMIGHCQSASAVAGIIKATLALHHKILPTTLHVTKPNAKIDWATHPCYVNTQTRPWIKARDNDAPRRAAVSAFGFGGVNGHMVLQEFVPVQAESIDISTAAHEEKSLMHVFDSEIFTLQAESREGIVAKLQELLVFAQTQTAESDGKNLFRTLLKDLAYTVNCQSNATKVTPKAPCHRLALVATDLKDLTAKLQTAIDKLQQSDGKLASKVEIARDIYYTAPGAPVGGKLAFLYPGLGSAYTNMLADLCIYFPEVREVFDIVDSVALSAGATTPPSKSIFPAPFEKGQRVVPALLGTADFAVVAVLLAEYAMTNLLKHLSIDPDVIMGCSTGEFAAITTTGSVDVFKVAKTFYQLSTRVARSIPAESLADLRTLRVMADWPRVQALANGPLYLSADLSRDHIIVTGDATTVADLTAKLKNERISCQLLPVPIPYHTPLVSSIIDANNEAVRAVDIQPLSTPGWSCSTAALYPQDVESMRLSFVELFTRPIALRQTVEAMYKDGVRTFVEVGPNGILTSSIAGILEDSPHVAVASNLASRSGITQLNHLLAVLFTQDVDANFAFLYKRREPVAVDILSVKNARVLSQKMLSLTHTALKVDASTVPDLPVNYVASDVDDDVTDISEQNSEQQDDDLVLQSFLKTNASFYGNINATTQTVMQNYFESAQSDLSDDDELIYEQDALSFLKRAQIYQGYDQTELLLPLSLDSDPYLHDHAIGGVVSTVSSSKVHLVPLMVTLEMMAQAAYAHIGEGYPVRIEQVKAFKRIVVDTNGLTLRAVATTAGDKVHVELSDGSGADTVYAKADFIFAAQYLPCPAAPSLSVASGAAPVKLTSKNLYYGDMPMTMFHGPRMQAVKSIDNVGNRSISGTATALPAKNWEPGDTTSNHLLHPLLLDNASQFVLFYLYEKNMSATALLPFLIESVEYFAPPHDTGAPVAVTAVLPTLTERATQADLEIVQDGLVLLKINGINSRRVLLSEQWQQFVINPINTFLGTELPLASDLSDSGLIVKVDQAVLPTDDVILDWCLDYILTRNEQTVCLDHAKTKKRKIDWLMGRIAAKEAVRKFVFKKTGRLLGPHDVEILSFQNGAPVVRLADNTLPQITVSISHTESIGVAIATFSGGNQPGIDAEKIRDYEPSFASTFLKPHELNYLATCPADKINNELTRLWSAKEALFKASGGLIEMSSFALTTDRPGTEIIEMQGGSPLKKLRTYVATISDLVIAYVV